MHAEGPRPVHRSDSAFNPWWVSGIALVSIFLWLKFERPAQQREKAVVAAQPAPMSQPPRINLPTVRPDTTSPDARSAPSARQQASPQPIDRRQTEPAPWVPQRTDPPPPTTQTLYLCKSYGGSTFWSNAVCSSQRATIDRMVSVPSSLPFAQQVAIAQGEARAAEALYAPTQPQQNYSAPRPQADPRAQCPGIEAEIQRLDALARQPQSAQMQDWIKQRKLELRSRQGALRC